MNSSHQWTDNATQKWDDSNSFAEELDSDALTKIVANERAPLVTLEELTAQPGGKYKVLKHIDQGGMKSILEVKDKDTMRNMAMAVLVDESETTNISRFVQEARITANLEHPNIMPIHDIGVDESGAPYFTMKRVRGETLAKVLQKLKKDYAHYHRKYDLTHLLQIFRKVCDAINFAHSKGIVHLDLKPANILVGEYGEVLVLDWGLAKYIGPEYEIDEEFDDFDTNDEKTFSHISLKDANITIDGEIKGTPGFMAPEQAAGRNHEKDQRTDIYALGAILYKILTYEIPISSKQLETVFNDTIEGNFVPPRQRKPEMNIPVALEAITMKAMATDPAMRYQHVKRIIKDLEKYSEGHATSAEEASLFKHFRLLVRRRKVESILVVTIIAFTLIIIATWLTNMFKQQATWGPGENITPETQKQLDDEWTMIGGQWKFDNGRLEAVSGKGDSFRLFFNRPVFGNIAIEFKGRIENAADLEKSGDLSVILCGNPITLAGYYFQIGGVGNTSAIIQRKGGLMSSVNFRLRAGQTYHIRAEKEGEWLRLYCNGELLHETKDIFYLEGGLVGLYTFGKGKKFWDIKLYHRGVPELISPLMEGDSYFRESRATSGEIRRKFLEMARSSYLKVFESHPDKELGYQARLKKAYVEIELGNISDAQFDCGYLEYHYQNLEQMLLKGELAFYDNDFENAYQIFRKAVKDYPRSKIGTIGVLSGKLNIDLAAKVNEQLLMKFWRLCASNQSTPILRCSEKGLPSLAFAQGLRFELIDCSDNKIKSLEPLKGMGLKRLDCADNQISDLTPLEGMKLKELECYGNPIKSIAVLAGMPLKSLALNDCPQLNDLTPLKGCETLEKLTIPKHIKDIEFLRKMPNLKYLNTEWDSWTKTAEQFWKEYDAAKRRK